MAFGFHGKVADKQNRKMQSDYRFRANHKKKALKSSLSKAQYKGAQVSDTLSPSRRNEIRRGLRSSLKKGRVINIITLIILVLLLVSVVRYIS